MTQQLLPWKYYKQGFYCGFYLEIWAERVTPFVARHLKSKN